MSPNLRALIPRGTQFAYWRGGTSRATVFLKHDLPRTLAARHALFLQAIGTPDPYARQLNGLGAGVSSLSKVCILEKAPPESDVDILYTFVGIGIERPEVDYAGNCGNMAAAVGPAAWEAGLVSGKGEDSNSVKKVGVRFLNTNTNTVIQARFPVLGNRTIVDSSTTVDGVSGLGTHVTLDFLRPGGSKTGALLPTGNAVDSIHGFRVSCVDSANPCVFVRAHDVPLPPTILPAALAARGPERALLETLRRKAAVRMGLCAAEADTPRVVPKIAVVAPPQAQTTLAGVENPAEALDLVVRFISDELPHRAIPLTGALCTATAARVEGSVVNACLGERAARAGSVTIGHPSGRVEVDAEMVGGEVVRASVVRTARCIVRGEVLWNWDGEEEDARPES